MQIFWQKSLTFGAEGNGRTYNWLETTWVFRVIVSKDACLCLNKGNKQMGKCVLTSGTVMKKYQRESFKLRWRNFFTTNLNP